MADPLSINGYIDLKWVGIRKDANKGSFWGYFVPKDQDKMVYDYWDEVNRKFRKPDKIYYKFYGKIGKSITIEKVDDFEELTQELADKSKNFRVIENDKFLGKCGSSIAEEFLMQISIMKMRGELVLGGPLKPEQPEW